MMMSIRLFSGNNSGSNYVNMPNCRTNNVSIVNKFYLRGSIH